MKLEIHAFVQQTWQDENKTPASSAHNSKGSTMTNIKTAKGTAHTSQEQGLGGLREHSMRRSKWRMKGQLRGYKQTHRLAGQPCNKPARFLVAINRTETKNKRVWLCIKTNTIAVLEDSGTLSKVIKIS